MRLSPLICLAVLVNAQSATFEDAAAKAASKYIPDVIWQPKSSVTGDFTCVGRKQAAVLGTAGSDVVLAVFLNGLDRKPEELRFDIFLPKLARLQTETLDYEPDYKLPGYQRSKKCLGLNVGDGEKDSAHLYWDRDSKRFGMWRL